MILMTNEIVKLIIKTKITNTNYLRNYFTY